MTESTENMHSKRSTPAWEPTSLLRKQKTVCSSGWITWVWPPYFRMRISEFSSADTPHWSDAKTENSKPSLLQITPRAPVSWAGQAGPGPGGQETEDAAPAPAPGSAPAPGCPSGQTRPRIPSSDVWTQAPAGQRLGGSQAAAVR